MAHLVGHRTLKAKSLNYELTLFETEKTDTGRTEGEGEFAFFSAKHWDRRKRADLIESATPCHDAQVVGPYRDSNPLRLTVLAAMSEDYTTAPQHLQRKFQELSRKRKSLRKESFSLKIVPLLSLYIPCSQFFGSSLEGKTESSYVAQELLMNLSRLRTHARSQMSLKRYKKHQ